MRFNFLCDHFTCKVFTYDFNTKFQLEISSDNWIQNVLKIYKQQINGLNDTQNFSLNNIDTTWAFPIISKSFYNSLSHKIGMFFN